MNIEEFMTKIKVGDKVKFRANNVEYEGKIVKKNERGFVLDDGEDEIFFSKKMLMLAKIDFVFV